MSVRLESVSGCKESWRLNVVTEHGTFKLHYTTKAEAMDVRNTLSMMADGKEQTRGMPISDSDGAELGFRIRTLVALHLEPIWPTEFLK